MLDARWKGEMIMQGLSNVNNTVKLMVGIFLGIGINTVSAQTQTDDKELRLNKDVVKMIQFDFSGMEVLESQPEEAPVDKKWMNFKTDIGIPRSLLDTTIVKKPEGYIRLLPYSIWTRFGDDPVYDVLIVGRKKEREMTWKLSRSMYKDEYGRTILPSPGRMYESVGGSAGAGVAITVDFNKFLTENLTRRGRMLRHNRKYANAWKIYKDYQPTKEDSLKFPNFYRWMQASASLTDSVKPDSLTHIPSVAAKDTLPKVQPVKRKSQADEPESAGDWYKYIRRKQAEDSVRKKEFFRKDKVRQNAYELEQQTRYLKDLQN